jgi:pimeloyl-ACP methyl ester carboxylesterase
MSEPAAARYEVEGSALAARYEVEGGVLAVRTAGDAEKPTLLLIHGFPSSSRSFRNVMDTLARDCFVVAPDLPGFGGSDPMERPSFSRFADVIHGLLARLGFASFHLACWRPTRPNAPR